MKNILNYCIATSTVLLIVGCASNKPKPQPVQIRPVQPVVQVIPTQGIQAPRVATIADKPQAIYKNPVLEEVEMAPYVNDEGNLVFPGKMYVVREPGHWNLDAAKKSSRYYVPADNQPAQLIAPSKGYYDYIQSKQNGQVASELNISNVRVTGYTQQEERQAAQGLLKPGETLAYDKFLGWLAVPSEQLGAETPAPTIKAPKKVNTVNLEAPTMEPTATVAPIHTPVTTGTPVTTDGSSVNPAQMQNTPPSGVTQTAPPAPIGTVDTVSTPDATDQARKLIDDAFKQAAQKHQ